MSGQHGFDFHRAKGVTRNVQHVVDTAGDGEVSGLRVTDRTVAGLIQSSAEFFRPVMGLVAFVVAPDGTDHGRPRTVDYKDTALPVRQFLTGFIDNADRQARQWQSA